MEDLFIQKRNSFMELEKIYFWTATINKFQNLLLEDPFKQVILNSFDYLTRLGKIDVFGFVIMPNHIHVIWKCNELNGKESAKGSFLKYTAHEFKKLLNNQPLLNKYAVSKTNKKFEFWQRDPLAIHLYDQRIAFQKLDYIHNNPITTQWSLATEPANYFFSSASYYENDEIRFPFLKDLRLEF